MTNFPQHSGTETKEQSRSKPEHGGDVAEHAQARLGEAGERLREQAEHVADSARTRAADELRTFGEAARAASEQLKEDEHRKVGSYAGSITSGCEQAADYLEHADFAELGHDVAQFARRNPALFLGGVALAGFAFGRLLSATPPRQTREQQPHNAGPYATRHNPASSSTGKSGEEGTSHTPPHGDLIGGNRPAQAPQGTTAAQDRHGERSQPTESRRGVGPTGGPLPASTSSGKSAKEGGTYDHGA
jgi:hypothetical protein